jgi:hypothetical protein
MRSQKPEARSQSLKDQSSPPRGHGGTPPSMLDFQQLSNILAGVKCPPYST